LAKKGDTDGIPSLLIPREDPQVETSQSDYKVNASFNQGEELSEPFLKRSHVFVKLRL